MKKIIISLLIMVCFVGMVGCNENDNKESRERKSKITTKAEQTESIIAETESQTTDLKSSEILDEKIDDNGSKYTVAYFPDDNSIMILLSFEASEIEYNTNVIKAYLVNYLELTTIDTLSVIATQKGDSVMLAQFIKENDKLMLDPVVGIIWSNDDYETEFNKSSAQAETSFITLSDNTDKNGNRLVASCDDKAIHVTLKYYLSSIENVENNTERIMALLLTSSDYTQADYLTVLIYDKQSEELIMMTMMQNDNGKFKGATGFIWENSEYEEAYIDYMNQISDKIQQHTKTE